MEKARTKSKVLIASPVAQPTIEDVAARYVDIRQREKAIAAEKKEVQDLARSIMGRKREVETAYGTFRIETASSFAWSVAFVKKHFGPAWESFIKADDKLIREKMKTDPSLFNAAEVTEIEKLTLR